MSTPTRRSSSWVSPHGWLKALSHETITHWPYHTHKAEDCQKLAPGEIVEATVEMPPTTARLKRGWKLLLTVTPVGAEMYEPHGDYVAGSENTLYTGPEHDSYLQLALI